MTAPLDSVWLQHVGLPGEDGHGGAFLCPAGAVADWKAMGWEPADNPPEEPNPVVAENIAAQQAAAEQAKADEAVAKKATKKATKDTDTSEGN